MSIGCSLRFARWPDRCLPDRLKVENLSKSNYLVCHGVCFSDDVQLDANPAHVTGDAARLQQIVWHLLTNAVKFTPRRGEVHVCLGRSGEDAELRVRDSGEGIAADFLRHVFAPFRQADGSSTRSHRGIGLELAVVRHLTEAHGGTIAVHSDGPGCGATFTMTLPLQTAATEAEPTTVSSRRTVRLETI